jgi:outer membrane protein assembly factor BamA
MRPRRARLPLIVAIFLITGPALVPAVGRTQGLGGSGQRIEDDVKFLPIPYINYDRSIGFQLGALPMAMFNPVESDTISPSSIAGLFGMYSTNETWFLMGFGRVHLDEDNWRVTVAGGSGSVNFQFFLDGPAESWIPYNTEMDLAFAKLQRRVYERLYVGVSYIYMNFRTTVEIAPETFTNTLQGAGLSLALDHRSSVFYPRGGFETRVDFLAYPEAFGNEVESNKIQLEYNHYLGLRDDRDVLAGRAFVGLGLGDLTFNQQFIAGRKSDIRGYTQGEYRGNYLVALQGEYRWNFHPRWGLVGFAGLATVFEAINPDEDGRLLPGVGTGFRFTMDTETKMNVGMDIAVGRNDWGIYFRIGEAF